MFPKIFNFVTNFKQIIFSMDRGYIYCLILLAVLYGVGWLYRRFDKMRKLKQAEKEEQRKLNSDGQNAGAVGEETVPQKEEHGFVSHAKRYSKKLMKGIGAVIGTCAVLVGIGIFKGCMEDIRDQDKFKDLEGTWTATYVDEEEKREATPEEQELFNFEYKETITFKGAEIESLKGAYSQKGEFEQIIVPVTDHSVGVRLTGKYEVVWAKTAEYSIGHPYSNKNRHTHVRPRIETTLTLSYKTEKFETLEGEIIEKVKIDPVINGSFSPEEIEEEINELQEYFSLLNEENGSFEGYYDINVDSDGNKITIGGQSFTRVK